MNNIIGLKTINSVNLLKVDSNGELTAVVNNNNINIKTGGTPNVYPTVNIPIPFDEDNHTLTLIVDISLTEEGFAILDELSNDSSSYTETQYTNDNVTLQVARINIADYVNLEEGDPNIGKIKIINHNGQIVDLPSSGIGTAYYGSTVFFKIDESMFRMAGDSQDVKHFQLGKTYYCRYTWVDQEGASDVWKGFAFTYDAVMNKSVSTTSSSEDVYSEVIGHKNVSGDITLDYSVSQIHLITTAGNTNITTTNIPYGKQMYIYVVNYNGEVTVENGDLTLEDSIITQLITVYNHIGTTTYTVNQVYGLQVSVS